MNKYRPVTMIAMYGSILWTHIAGATPETHNLKISAQIVTHRSLEIGERPPYTMYVLYAAFLFLA